MVAKPRRQARPTCGSWMKERANSRAHGIDKHPGSFASAKFTVQIAQPRIEIVVRDDYDEGSFRTPCYTRLGKGIPNLLLRPGVAKRDHVETGGPKLCGRIARSHIEPAPKRRLLLRQFGGGIHQQSSLFELHDGVENRDR